MKFKLYLTEIEMPPIIVDALTLEDALSMSEDIFGERVLRLEEINEEEHA